MVDFNNDTTVTTPASDLVRVIILERRYNLIEMIERYMISDGQGVDARTDLEVIKARLHSLYYEIESVMIRHLPANQREDFLNDMSSGKFDPMMRAFRTIDEILDKVRLTRIDLKTQYDPTRVENENKEKDL